MNTIRNIKSGRFERVIPIWTPENWNSGYVDNKGRFRVYRPDYPRAYKEGYALRSHIVWWLEYGKPHPEGYDIHHKDRTKLNDNIENLEIKLHKDHAILHNQPEGPQFICENCEKKFIVPRWRLHDGRHIRFCSQTCYHSYPRTNAHNQHIKDGMVRAYKENRR